MNLTVRAVAARLGVSASLVYAWCRRRLLPHFRFGRPGRRGKVLVPEDALAAFAEQHRLAPEPPVPSRPLVHIRLSS